MLDLPDVVAFLRVVETGSFGRAADRLGVAKSIISRRVANLEKSLGARLLVRTPSGARPSEVGQAYFELAGAGLAQFEAAREAVAAAMLEIAGPIRLTAPLSFGINHLAPVLADFADAHPRIDLDIFFDDRSVDLVGGGFDVGVRIGKLPDSSLVARRLTIVRRVLLASPGYLAKHGAPTHPRDLTEHASLVYANASAAEHWRFRIGSRWEQVRVKARLRADNGEMLREAACAGLGIANLPTFIASQALEAGRLRLVLPEFPLEEVGLHAIMPPGRAVTARVRALVDCLTARFGSEPRWDPCHKSAERVSQG